MHCTSCQSSNIRLLKQGEFYTGFFCDDFGFGNIEYHNGTCCGNQLLIDIRFEQANKTIVQRTACKNCKTLVGGAKKKGEYFLKLPLLTQERFKEIEGTKKSDYSVFIAYLNKLRDDFKQNQSAEWWQNYSAYLLTDKWKGKRAQVLEREHGICQGCGYSKAIHVHHTTYENLGDELLFQLVALCVTCHSKLHPSKNLS